MVFKGKSGSELWIRTRFTEGELTGHLGGGAAPSGRRGDTTHAVIG